MKKPALLIIDMLKDYFEEGELLELRDTLIKNINSLAKHARNRNVPIIWVRQEFEPDLSDAFLVMKDRNIKKTIKGTRGAEILDELDKAPEDFEIVKKRYSAFFKTGLDELLKELQPSSLILTGINTHACIRTAAIDAYQRDYRVIIPEDCVHSWDEEHHEISLKYLGREISRVAPSSEVKLLFD